MPRIARVVIPGIPHHVTQRGNNRQAVFFSDEDRGMYLAFLKKHAEQFSLEILGYCLMSNHLHLVAIPQREDSLAKAIGRTDFRYTQVVNQAHGWSGHLWQNRFFSCPLEEPHLWNALGYVDRNPVRARLHRDARRYRWSSAGVHCGGEDPAGLVDPAAWRQLWGRGDWERQLQRPEDGEQLRTIRQHTHTGRALGSLAFVARLEKLTGRTLQVRPVGRPRQAGAAAEADVQARRKREK